MSTTQVPSRPDLGHLRHQARDLQRTALAAEPAALQRLIDHHPDFASLSVPDAAARGVRRADAQFVIAGERCYASWPRLKRARRRSDRAASPSAPAQRGPRLQPPEGNGPPRPDAGRPALDFGAGPAPSSHLREGLRCLVAARRSLRGRPCPVRLHRPRKRLARGQPGRGTHPAAENAGLRAAYCRRG